MKNVAFATCVQLGLSCIEEILSKGKQIDLLITLNDDKGIKKSGRVYLDEISEKNKIELLKINNINEEIVINKLKEKNIDWLFIIGWSQIAKKELISTPNLGCLGMHPTLLPNGRGRAAIPWAIINNLSKTGVTLFRIDEGVDTGDIIDQIEIPIDSMTTATDLYKKIDRIHVELINKNIDDIYSGAINLTPQNNEDATYWEGRRPEDGELDNKMSVEEAHRLVRATTKPYPGAFIIKDNKKIIIWEAEKSFEAGDVEFVDGFLKIKKCEVEELGNA